MRFVSTGDHPITEKVMQCGTPISLVTDSGSANYGELTVADLQGQTITIATPERNGYRFSGWKFTFINEDGDEVVMGGLPTSMTAHDILATPLWEAQAMVDYKIVYWKQKPVVKGDKDNDGTPDMEQYPTDINTYNSRIGNYDYDAYEVVSAGARVGMKSTDLIAQLETAGTINGKYPTGSNDKVTYEYKGAVASVEELKINGSTVINVFYNRKIIHYYVNWKTYNVEKNNNHLSEYVGLQGANIADYYDGFTFDTAYGWQYQKSGSSTTTINTFVSSFVDIDDGTQFTAESRSTTDSKAVHFIEQPDGTFQMATEPINLTAQKFGIGNKFSGYNARGYRVVTRRYNQSQNAYVNDYITPNTDTTAGYKTVTGNGQEISLALGTWDTAKSIQIYHYRETGYAIEMFYGSSTGNVVQFDGYGGADSDLIHYGDSVWEVLSQYCQARGYNDSVHPMPDNVRADNADTNPANNWVWKGWYMIPDPKGENVDSSKYTAQTTDTFMGAKTIRIFAVWQPPQCEVTFRDPAGMNEDKIVSYDKYDLIAPSELYDGSKLNKPTIKNDLKDTDAYYEFEGWYYDENFSAKYDTARKIENPFTLYARWVLKGLISYKVKLYNTKGEVIGEEQIQISPAGVYKVVGLTYVDGYENTGATKRVYVDADLISTDVTAYIEDNVGVYQVHCIEDNDANKKITSYFYGTTYAEKYVTPPKLDGYMFVGYSRKSTYNDDGRLEQKCYQVIKKNEDCVSTGTGYVKSPEVIFHYKKIIDVPIEIRYFKENDEGTFTQDTDATKHITGANVGELVDFKAFRSVGENGEVVFTNYAPDDKYQGYFMSVSPVDLKKTISSIDSRNIINVFYRRKYCEVNFIHDPSKNGTNITNMQMRLVTDPGTTLTRITEKVKVNDKVVPPEVYGLDTTGWNGNRYKVQWCTKDTQGNLIPFDFNTNSITGNMTVYANWVDRITNPWYVLEVYGASDEFDYTAQPHNVTERKNNVEDVITDIKFTYNRYSSGTVTTAQVEKSSSTLSWIGTDRTQFQYIGRYTVSGTYQNAIYQVTISGHYHLSDKSEDTPVGGVDTGMYNGQITIDSVQQQRVNNNGTLSSVTSILSSTTVKSSPGYVLIKPAEMKITTDSMEDGQYKYNGQNQTKKSGKITINTNGTITEIPIGEGPEVNLLSDDKMTYEFTGKQKDAGTSANTIDITSITTARTGTVDASQNYRITYELGRLIVRESDDDWEVSGVVITSVDAEVDGQWHGITVEDTENHNYRFLVKHGEEVYRYATQNPRFNTSGYRRLEVIVVNPNYSTPKTILYDKDGDLIHVKLGSNDVIPSGLVQHGLPYIILTIFSFILVGTVVVFRTKNKERSGSEKTNVGGEVSGGK